MQQTLQLYSLVDMQDESCSDVFNNTCISKYMCYLCAWPHDKDLASFPGSPHMHKWKIDEKVGRALERGKYRWSFDTCSRKAMWA